MVHGLKDLKYEDRLKRFGVYSLQRRRFRGDLIETFKILTGKECIDKRQFFSLSVTTNLRGHDQKLFTPRSHLQVRQKLFSQWIIDTWNKLPQEVVESTSISMFKNRLNDYWNDVGTKS